MDLSFTPMGRNRSRELSRGFAVAPDFGMLVAGVSTRQAGSPTARAQAAIGSSQVPSSGSFHQVVAELLTIAGRG